MNFVSHVRNQIVKYGDDRHYIFLRGKPDDLSTQDKLSYNELDQSARRIAVWLSMNGAVSEPVLLVYPEGLDFLQAFLGCLYAGVIAVPVPFPNDARSVDRIKRVLIDANVRLVLTTSTVQDALDRFLRDADLTQKVSYAATDVLEGGDIELWRQPNVEPGSIAFLQYTSGSTSEPKGVIVTHGNLLHNEAQIQQIVASNSDSTVVGWLPHFHDMGLIGILLHPLYVACNCVFMAPSSFLKRPFRWLEAITYYSGTHTAAPDFAYEMCTRSIKDEQIASLDLSSLQVAMSGAETVRARTVEAFSQRFGIAGFAEAAFSPCYGMAEVTLLATGSRTGAPPVFRDVDPRSIECNQASLPGTIEMAKRLVSSGNKVDLDLCIVDPQTLITLQDGSVGEIWLRGDSIARGYWGRPELTEAVFKATTAEGDGPYLRTGDMGFVVDGELYVTGRLKDIVIINGRNLYPQDIEHFVRELHPALAAGTAAAFSVDAGGEKIVIVQEVRASLLMNGVSAAELSMLIKTAVAHAFEVATPSISLIRNGQVQRTTSGKVQRHLMRTLFLKKQLSPLHEDIPHSVQQLLDRESSTLTLA